MDKLNRKRIIPLSLKRAREGNKSLIRQLLEILLLYLRYGYGPAFYHEARFWRAHINLREMDRYLIGSRYFKEVIKINTESYYKCSQNKLVEKSILTMFRVPSPSFYAFISKEGRVLSRAGGSFALEEAGRLFEKSTENRFCVKDVEGFGGSSFGAFEIIRKRPALLIKCLESSDTVPFYEFIQDRLRFVSTDTTINPGLLVEEYFIQHSSMSKLNSSSVNTLRLWARQRGDDVRVVGALLRIGRRGALIDNSTGGGMVAKVDLESGRVEKAYFMNGEHNYFSSHPDHGANLEGTVIPMWTEAKELACRTLRIFPGINFAGFDIALGEAGPVVIELNVQPEPLHATVFDTPTLDLIG